MLVTLETKVYVNMTVPSKVQSYMAAGKPIIGAINGSCANFIKNNEIGYTCNADDLEELAKLIQELDGNKLHNIGKHSKEVYFKRNVKDKYIKELETNLSLLCTKTAL